MPNKNGSVYGLTLLCPIINDPRAVPSHDLQIRNYLAHLPTDCGSPFAKTPGTHLCRLVVLDDVIYVGMPSCEEHLKSKYLVLEANIDGDLEPWLRGFASAAPEQIDCIWTHCAGYPGVSNLPRFFEYIKACQVTTTFFFAAVNDKTVKETLVALQTQRAVAEFITEHQGVAPEETQRDFLKFLDLLKNTPPPAAGAPFLSKQ